MDVNEAIQTMLAVRSYTDQSIPEESVRRILEAARLTASSSNKQPWHFVAVQDPATLQKLGGLAPSGPYIAQAKLAVVVVGEQVPSAMSDASRAIQDMMLVAWSEGIGSNWVGPRNTEGVAELLGIPADLRLLAIIPFGYPAQRVGKGKKNRKPLAEIAHRERWDQPFA